MRERFTGARDALIPLSPVPDFSVLAVVVLYKCDPATSEGLMSLIEAQRSLPRAKEFRLSILVIDNTPGQTERPTLPPGVTYLAWSRNLGLAPSYNEALFRAEQLGYTWLLTLDQDTLLPQDFLSSMGDYAREVNGDPAIAAVVPQVSAGNIKLSPHRLLVGAVARYFADGYTGVPSQHVYAFNSASLLRVSALQQVDGYDPRFWLDHSDTALFHRLHSVGKQVFVAGSVRVEHQLSLKAMHQRVTAWRYEHMLLAESAFWDQEMTLLAGLERTLRLALRYGKQVLRRDDRALRWLTLRFLFLRLFRSRKHRLHLFENALQEHFGGDRRCEPRQPRQPKVSVCMAAYNGAPYIQAQLASIWPQLAETDEIVIVDDASTDDTVQILQSTHDKRLRLFAHSQNKGVVATFEDTLRAASGDVLFLADDDDLWNPNKVAKFKLAFAQSDKVAVVMSAVQLIDSAGSPFQESRWDRGGRFRAGWVRNILKNQYQGSAMAIRSTMLGSILPFRPKQKYLHDAWIGTTNDRRGGDITFLPEPLLLYRRHSKNFSRKLSRKAQVQLRWQLLWAHVKQSIREI